MKQKVLLIFILLGFYKSYCQPTQPILRIENGMHSATGRRISTDSEGKFLLSCSDDKTARLWDAVTGKLLNTLRIPIGGTDEGKIYGCVLNRNGTLAALAGWSGYEWDEKHSIYIVNTQTGKMIHRVTGLSSVINDMEFSLDGNWLAAGMGGSNGVRIFDIKSWSEIGKLEGYNGDVYNVAFDKNNRLATVCFDGKLRLYNSRFELIKTQESLAGKEPYSLALNSSGTLLAIGYNDVSTIEVRSGDDLKLLFKPSLENTEDKAGDLNVFSFSTDGTHLYGGGSYSKSDGEGNWKRVLRIWSDSGRGSYTDILLTENTIMDIKSMHDGNVAVIGAYPDIALVSAKGEQIWGQSAVNNDYRAVDKSHFRINNSGNSIGFKPFNKESLSFDLRNRLLTEEVSNYPSPWDKNAGTEVSDYKQSYNPFINSNKITFLSQYEKCFSTDINRTGKEIILGAAWDLYKADDKAQLVWKTDLPSDAYAVNISGNDKTVIAALGDGTIRWYSMDAGKELLAFYLHSDKKRWVLFTPSGYYDASPGAEDMLGWHVNNGPDETPDFYPVSRFREQYYRPDIIDAVLETYDEEKAITLANSLSKRNIAVQTPINDKLPPVITITGPLNGSTVSNEMVAVSYYLKTPNDAAAKTIKVLVNGRPVLTERGTKVINSNTTNTINVNIPAEDCTITLLAENDNGISPEANLYLKYKAVEKPQDQFVKKPKLYVLSIGINEYQNPDFKLKYAANDANGFSSALLLQKGGLYEDVIVKSLLDQNATRENIQDGLQWIQEETTQKDVAMIFYAGHGINDNNGIFYMLPVAADINRLRSTCLNFEELKQTVSNTSGKVVVFIDACHSGNVMGNNGTRGVADINALVNELSSTENGAITFTSSTGKEYSLENIEWMHGAFTKALLEGLSGKASVPGKNKITVKSLDAFISERVKELTKGKQHPTSVVPPNVPDFPIAIGK